jgi:sialate O-acetylesterase
MKKLRSISYLKNIIRIICLFLFLIPFSVLAEVSLPSVFADNMVLQQKSKASFWGKADVGEKISVTTTWGEKKSFTADSKGEWSVKLSTPKGSYTAQEITIKGENEIILSNVLIGEVWLCSGQSNMGWSVKQSDNAEKEIKNANYPNIRFFHIPNILAWEPQYDVDAEWKVCSPETTARESASAYFFGRELHQKLDVPIGLIVCAWGASGAQAWIDKESAAKEGHQDIVDWYNKNEAKLKKYRKEFVDGVAVWKKQQKEGEEPNWKTRPKRKIPGDQNIPFALYNGMIHPIKTFTMQGAIWYQGESNVARANQYRTLFPAMIRSWRKVWNQGDFPFYQVQIAPFHYRDSLGVTSAELRDAQLKTLDIEKNVGMIVTSDISFANNIHPRNKQEVGKRLAMLALHNDYKTLDENYSSAFYKSAKIKGNKVTINFKHAEKLKVDGNEITGLIIAGDDRKFVQAKAKIVKGNQLEVWADGIANPASVRFGWSNAFQTNLFNEIDLPVSPFKTDNWDDTTKGEIHLVIND